MKTTIAVWVRCVVAITIAASAGAVEQTVSTRMDALDAYEWGFATDVIRGEGGIVLNDLVLLEDDGPGVGHSEKGTFIEVLHEGVQIKKLISLDDTRAKEAHVILYMEPQGSGDFPPYYIVVNGHRIEGNPVPWHEGRWHWVKVPTEYLVKGVNEIVVGSDAPEDKGYHMLVAREDEYEKGGGKYTYQGNTALISSNQIAVPANAEEYGFQPIHVGENSAKSIDGGKTWTKNRLGTTNDVVGEYSIRLNLTKHKESGVLRSDAIDLWEGLDGLDKLKPPCELRQLSIRSEGETPTGTGIVWSARFADTPDMMSEAWGPFERFGEGANVTAQVDSGGKRFLQWEAKLQTANPLATPVVRAVTVDRTLAFDPPQPNTFYVKQFDNPRLRYSSYTFAYEDAAAPQLAQLRNRLELQKVIDGATGDFDKINRLRHYVSQLWYHGAPLPEYPEWNALDILDRKDKFGHGGMCIQFSITFIQSLEALGYQARHLNIFNHETVEVYIDELGKWVHVDPESVFDSYEFDTNTGMPINTLEQHGYFLAKYGLSAENPIDWMSTQPWANHPDAGLPENKQPLEISTYTPHLNSPDPKERPPQHNLVGFIRMMPRNNYFSQPTPRPLNQGCTWWPWDGYVNWYDDATPRKLQYALHTDRISDFYPTLNQVAFSAVHGETEGEIVVDMVSFTPNFDSYEINIDDTGWRDSDAHFVWRLNRSALNRLEMRTRNSLGVTGYPSQIEVIYHYREPYQPKKRVAAANE